jgi:hypothetical protein
MSPFSSPSTLRSKSISKVPASLPTATWSARGNSQQRLVKTGGRLIKHARYYWRLLAESHLTRRLFGAMVGRIESLPLPAG